ncbi:hypothetical protein J2X02_003474 [Pseudoxanthomonas japonensis]|uniref:hypothetical protein n=1 Tax=Pseudoxanthomonas japonensis TaxID=69284 RepID=UPI0028553BB1|nr:hypothetical protein [Pseudoxanthomonas japonensis]
MTGRATDEQLDDLHRLVGETLLSELTRYTATGEPIPPQLFSQVLKYLKDNGIDAPSRAVKLRDRLAETMPDFDDPPDGAPAH